MTIRRIIGLIVLLLMAAYIHPAYREMQPAAQVTVVDQHNVPVADAKAILTTVFFPDSPRRPQLSKKTGSDGKFDIPALHVWRAESLMFDIGEQELVWNWCIEKEGYATVETFYRGRSDFVHQPTFRLTPGPSYPCPVSNPFAQ